MEANQKEFKNAPFWKRLVGLLIDTIVIFTIVLIITGQDDNSVISLTISSFLGSLSGGPIPMFLSILRNNSPHSIDTLIMLLIYYAYCLITELTLRNTIGKLIIGLKIISISTGRKASNMQIIGRALCRMIPFDVFSFFNPNPRGWHDSIPKTRVVNK
ncbi:MAG: RDD family protein [Acholeplasma sp.]|nr:RDD family protein [Acholeplasma sp.]